MLLSKLLILHLQNLKIQAQLPFWGLLQNSFKTAQETDWLKQMFGLTHKKAADPAQPLLRFWRRMGTHWGVQKTLPLTEQQGFWYHLLHISAVTEGYKKTALLCGNGEIFRLYCFKSQMEKLKQSVQGWVKAQIWISSKLRVLEQLSLSFSFDFLSFSFPSSFLFGLNLILINKN